MTYGNGYYPPGTPPPHETEVDAYCRNPDCEESDRWVGLPGIWELGAVDLIDEEPECSSCGWELDVDSQYGFALLSTGRGDRYAVVDIKRGLLLAAGSYKAMGSVYAEYIEPRRRIVLEKIAADYHARVASAVEKARESIRRGE